MARKEKLATVTAEGRDKGKNFLISEMSPRDGERWATRALLAFGRAGHGEMPEGYQEDLERSGMAGIAAIGIRALTSIRFEDAEPLLDEMMQCVAFVPDVTKIDQMTRRPIVRGLIEGDIEEIATMLFLRSEVLELHTGFSVAAFLSRMGAAAKERLGSKTTQTSPELSEGS